VGQPFLDCTDDLGVHLRGGMSVSPPNVAPPLSMTSSRMAHQLIDDPCRHACVLEPSRERVPQVVRAAEMQTPQRTGSYGDRRAARVAAHTRDREPGVLQPGEPGGDGRGSKPAPGRREPLGQFAGRLSVVGAQRLKDLPAGRAQGCGRIGSLSDRAQVQATEVVAG